METETQTRNFTRTTNPINIKIGGFYRPVFVTIKYASGKLSITGVEGPRSNGDCYGSCGQIEMGYDLTEDVQYNKGWDMDKWEQLLNVWREHHLNDMHAGTVKQEEALKERFGKTRTDYSERVEYLKSIGLHDDDGYKYGHGWLRRDVPEDVLNWLESLPETEIIPAWK